MSHTLDGKLYNDNLRALGDHYTLSARIIPHQPAEHLRPVKRAKNLTANVNSSRALYRVLGSGRQQPWLSVNREIVGRNTSEAIEPRQISRVWMPSSYCYSEGNTQALLGKISTGVRENSMLSRLMMREPRNSRASKVEMELKELNQEGNLKKVHTPTLDVRWFYSSKEAG